MYWFIESVWSRIVSSHRSNAPHCSPGLTTVVACSCVLASCATKYQEMGFTGGVSAQPVMTDVYRIQARGNAYTGSAAVQDFVLLKAAETTLAAGGSHFLILGPHTKRRWRPGKHPATPILLTFSRSSFLSSLVIVPLQDNVIVVASVRVLVPATAPGAFTLLDIARITATPTMNGSPLITAP